MIAQPAAAAVRATGKDRQRIAVLQGFRGAIDTIPSAVLGSPSIALEAASRTSSPAMRATALVIEEGDAERHRRAMQQALGVNRSKLSRRKAGTGRRNGWPGGRRGLGMW